MYTAIEVASLGKVYREDSTEVFAVNSVSFSVQRGEVVGIIGPSGSGKTTLLCMIGCILRPTEGTVKIYGIDVTALSEKQLPHIRRNYFGFIFQGFNLLSPLTALENVSLPLQMKGMPKTGADNISAKLLEKVGLKDRSHFLPRNLSSGEKQRVAIARALAGNPSIILADEPTGNLDHDNGKAIVKMLKDLVTETDACAVIVTHDSRIFHSLNRVFYMEDGKVRT